MKFMYDKEGMDGIKKILFTRLIFHLHANPKTPLKTNNDIFMITDDTEYKVNEFRAGVEELAFVMIREDMNGARYNIKHELGLSINDLWELDYHTFTRYAKRVDALREEYMEELKRKKKQAVMLEQEQQNLHRSGSGA